MADNSLCDPFSCFSTSSADLGEGCLIERNAQIKSDLKTLAKICRPSPQQQYPESSKDASEIRAQR